jgi:hypothetical protein
MRILWLATLLSVALAGHAAAQCCGDCAGDGEVTINDLIKAVGNALDGCMAVVTPTVGPSETPTKQPTPTRTPVRCPRDFTSANNQCVFNGRYNQGCGSAVNAAFSVSGTTVVVTVATGVTNPALVRFAAQRSTGSLANLTGWSSNDFQTVNPVAGVVELQGGGTQLVIFPNDPPFMIQGCNFVQYVGEYVRPRAALELDEMSDAASFANLEAWREQPIPELAP